MAHLHIALEVDGAKTAQDQGREGLRQSGLPRSGKNIWKINFFPGQGKVREFCGRSGKFRMDLESQGI